MNRLQKIGIGFGIALGIALFFLIVWRIGWVNYIDNYELGYTFDTLSGQIEPLEHTGYVVTWPFVMKVHHIDLRPMQLCISANQRTLNCKLVRFNPAGLQTFISWHGRDNYDIDGAQSDSTGSLRDIMKSYAFDESGTKYDFLTIMPGSANMATMAGTTVTKPVETKPSTNQPTTTEGAQTPSDGQKQP